MVSLVKKKVVLRTKSRGNKEKVHEKELEAHVFDYGESRLMEGTRIVVSAAVATFVLKEEDRHQVIRLTDDAAFGKCQKAANGDSKLAAFVGVFDGHDGDFASEYCSTGLVPHIVAELNSRSVAAQSTAQRWGFGADRANAPLVLDDVGQNDSSTEKKRPQLENMEIPYVAAFQKAHDRFCNHMEPPTFEEVSKLTGPLKVSPPSSYNPMQWMATAPAPKRGGTTACTMSVFTQQYDGATTSQSGTVFARVVVANTGDSRLITDDASGNHQYRQVTTDHRPSNPAEKRRLTECVARGETYMHRSSEHRDVRIFPGGLAVSRTIGDGNSSKSVICTPEVIDVPLQIDTESGKDNTQRFVLASDGLWDVLDNDAVGRAATRKKVNGNDSPKQATIVSPKEAATKILEKCLEAGGNRDDVTICVVDVSYQ